MVFKMCSEILSKFFYQMAWKEMEVSLPVRKALNKVHSEGPNHCHGVSAPLAQGMEQPPHSWKLPGLHADVRM